VRHQHPDVVGILRHEGQPGDRTPAAAEDVHRTPAHQADQLVHVVGVLAGAVLRINHLASIAPTRVVAHHRPVGEVGRELEEAGGPHRVPDHEQRSLTLRVRRDDVVDQHASGNLKGVGDRLWHGVPLSNRHPARVARRRQPRISAVGASGFTVAT